MTHVKLIMPGPEGFFQCFMDDDSVVTVEAPLLSAFLLRCPMLESVPVGLGPQVGSWAARKLGEWFRSS